ncbi:MAG TPA: hypothetical protein VLQ45_28610 [Thermoanaerobaculia bacterium]|nr:hypothetical protein [Thermoanaerobaculia bacterium]
MTPEIRQRVEQLVKPLYAGLDGVQTFDRVARLESHIQILREGLPVVDEDLLELLLLFHGAVDRIGSLAPGGRLDLFLRGLDLPEERIRRVRAALGRFREDPRGPEEGLLHDALLLESAGVVAAAERLMAAGKKRTLLARALVQLDPGPPPERYKTARGAALGAARRREAEEWIENLRQKVAEEGS